MTIYEFKLFNGKRYAAYTKQDIERDRAYFVELYGKERVGKIKKTDNKSTSYQFGYGGRSPGVE